MRFLDYLSEKVISQKEVTKTLQQDCKPILQWYKEHGHKRVLYRYSRVGRDDIIKLKTAREDRRPKDTPKIVSDAVDQLLYEKFGWRPRSEGVFSWYSKFPYPDPYAPDVSYFFPIGEYQYLWSSTVQDLYNSWTSDMAHRTDESSHEELVAAWMKKVVKNYKDKDLEKNDRNHEVMFKCKSYYLVSGNHVDWDELL